MEFTTYMKASYREWQKVIENEFGGDIVSVRETEHIENSTVELLEQMNLYKITVRVPEEFPVPTKNSMTYQELEQLIADYRIQTHSESRIKIIAEQLQQWANEDYQTFLMALIKFEKSINNLEQLKQLATNFMASDYPSFLISLFDEE